MRTNIDCYSNEACGCRMDTMLPSEPQRCPECNKKMVLMGKSRKLEYRLVCTKCGYRSEVLPKDKLYEIL